MGERFQDDRDNRNPVRKLQRDMADIKKEFDQFKKQQNNRALVAAVERVEQAIRQSKGDMTAEQERAFIADTAAGVAQNTREIEDAQKDATTKKK